MANLTILDGAGDTRYLKSSGAGTNGDPMIMEREVVQATPDDLNCNANLQVGNADVANGNPVPISDAGGALTVDGSVGMQVAAAAVTSTNPVPVIDAGGTQSSHAYTTSSDMSGSAADLTAAPTSGKKIVITDIIASAAASMVLTIKEETSGTVVVALALGANAPVHFPVRGKLKLAVADKKLQGQTSTSGNIYITIVYYSET